MKIFSINLLISLSLLCLSSLGVARRNLTSFEIEKMLRSVPVDFSQEGVVAEEIARIEVYQLFPVEEYEIQRGIEYFDKAGHTIGELDIVVFNRKTGKVVMVGEVKGGSSENGLRKAFMQREKFLECRKQGLIAHMNLRSNPAITFSLSQFESEWTFDIIGVIGQQQQQLLDIVLSFTRNQINELAKRLQYFQRSRWKNYRKRTGQNIKFHSFIARMGTIEDFDFGELFRDFNCARAF